MDIEIRESKKWKRVRAMASERGLDAIDRYRLKERNQKRECQHFCHFRLIIENLMAKTIFLMEDYFQCDISLIFDSSLDSVG